ncbi:hypothetical protein [Lysinibacillus sphaericus]|uniref:hypothetical protein n=1 Tax=Lysinibacillus sphaericus TaxID=1421 RepID=UPI000C18F5B7|nr:hypothetical protein [Lysinibacillus sphaericus]PIJ99980.1 hypothetical protein CTN02_03310 [Lysinibacillus sphaericus]
MKNRYKDTAKKIRMIKGNKEITIGKIKPSSAMAVTTPTTAKAIIPQNASWSNIHGILAKKEIAKISKIIQSIGLLMRKVPTAILMIKRKKNSL